MTAIIAAPAVAAFASAAAVSLGASAGVLSTTTLGAGIMTYAAAEGVGYSVGALAATSVAGSGLYTVATSLWDMAENNGKTNGLKAAIGARGYYSSQTIALRYGLAGSMALLPFAVQNIVQSAPAAKAQGSTNNYNWGDESTLQDHYERHGADVGATSAADYARKANDFYYQQNYNLIRIDDMGTIRVYDPHWDMFASYNVDGTTRTMYRPTDGILYFHRQLGLDY